VEAGSSTIDVNEALDREWYHTIEIAPGKLTPGWFDTRSVVAQIPFPESLDGKRCLDVGTFDGFWGFEMERRGAAEVLAIDLIDPNTWDWPAGSDDAVVDAIAARKRAGEGFEIARAALGSSVERRQLSVYDLDPDDVGTFDFVYVGSLLLHLRDPVRALERVRSVCTGSLLLVDAIDLGLTLLHPRRPVADLDGVGRPWWWKLNLAGLRRVVEVAGFEVVQPVKRIWMPPGDGQGRVRISPGMLRDEEARRHLMYRVKGDPHGAVLAKPRP
jgi:tRNA (mo5U34)-methyltransferase